MPLWRGNRQYVYHTCMRCGTRMPLAKMRWQNGLLVCHTNDCVDRGIMTVVGTRDVAVSRQIAQYRHELEVDPLLTNPVSRKDDMNEVLY